jgi:plastocyanin
MKKIHLPIMTALLLAIGAVGAGAADPVIVQAGRAFKPAEIQIGAGQSLIFSNDDEFIHQIYIAGLGFDSAEQNPGEKITVKFPKQGVFEVRCHIHPKMKLQVTVK